MSQHGFVNRIPGKSLPIRGKNFNIGDMHLPLSSVSAMPVSNVMNPTKKGLFVTDDGKNLTFTFILVSSLFLLWGICNGMIDVMDKHFSG